MTQVTRRQMRERVQAHEEFKGSNVFARWHHYGADKRPLYIVYSYGEHWPMFIYSPDLDMWFENAGRYSVTTTQQQGAAHPHTKTTKMEPEQMKDIVKHGLAQWVFNTVSVGV